MSKLTLNVDKELVEAAKHEAAVRKTSVSKLVSDYFRALSAERRGSHTDLPPITASLAGCLSEAEENHESYVDYLEEKHS